MTAFFPLAPRYRLDDPDRWLKGIDPSRHYWISVNGDPSVSVAIPGLAATSFSEFKASIQQFRALQIGEQMKISRTVVSCTIYCIGPNCYAIEADAAGAPVWHLFDQEAIESLLMTSHPDWKCAPSDLELGRELLARSFQQTQAA